MRTGTSGKAQIVAHRGASGHAPETTLEAYRLAIEMQADYVEMDVHMLRDGTVVAIHDSDVRRTTNGKGPVSAFTLRELKALDAGSWFNKAYPEKARPEYVGLKIPTLEEIIDLLKSSIAGPYIEIKDPERYPPDLESSILSVVRRAGIGESTRIISFSAHSICKVKTLDPSIRTGLLISRSEKNAVRRTLEAAADELAIRHDLATGVIVGEAHEKGISVSVWTVDQETEMRRMISLGVDRIITNYPDRLRRLFGRYDSPQQ